MLNFINVIYQECRKGACRVTYTESAATTTKNQNNIAIIKPYPRSSQRKDLPSTLESEHMATNVVTNDDDVQIPPRSINETGAVATSPPPTAVQQHPQEPNDEEKGELSSKERRRIENLAKRKKTGSDFYSTHNAKNRPRNKHEPNSGGQNEQGFRGHTKKKKKS
ncbi:unnamed protein product [Didymodactylos carnosus]|uniref:Uncharacterized protein n=1 Tax=Didymodactylos carnosus TaxID=1234261 RepID=A0A814F4L2_9BILA|nr:unnamed protein product [Didymodactylos carnosus]CAF0974947.1 unnamed protein product [Didymodactylos carnosus]CAF3655984.1 unnamed protein product [Didymodactylos carnosus]CAF3747801.1 unnamed protein product [Didymodactylos carnosus]